MEEMNWIKYKTWRKKYNIYKHRVTPPNECVFTGLGESCCIYKKSGMNPFVAPEKAAFDLINYPQLCHSMAELDCG